VGVLSFETVSGWPVWSSSFSATNSQTLSANWLAVFLLSVSAGWQVVLDECLSFTFHGCSFDAVSSVESVADLDWSTGIITSDLGEKVTLSSNVLHLLWLNAVVTV